MMIVDSATIHTSKLTHKWLQQHPRVQVLYLPKYIAADLNPVEKVWWRLKDGCAANRCFKNLEELTAVIHHFFQKFSAQAALRLIAAYGLTDRLIKAHGSR